MGYVIAGILVLLLVAGFVTFIVLNSMRKGSARSDHSGPAGMGPDPTPLGDTSEHAGEHTTGGETAEDPERNPGEAGYDPSGPGPGPAPERPEDRQRGHAGATAPQPESERLADRPR
jgi:hypothetical protein